MNEITTKARIRLKAEIMPLHCLVAPEGAPDCYGDADTRILGHACSRCSFRNRCADFTDRAGHDRSHGIVRGDPVRQRAVWPDSAPLILDLDRFFARVRAFNSRPPTEAEERLWALVNHPIHDGEMAIPPRRAYSGGLITVDAASEIAARGELFHCWLLARNPRGRWVRDVCHRARVGSGRDCAASTAGTGQTSGIWRPPASRGLDGRCGLGSEQRCAQKAPSSGR